MIVHQSENSVGDNSYKVTKYKGAKSWDYHFHTNLELIYMSEGELTIYTSGRKEEIKKGDFCLLLSGQPHAIIPSGDCEQSFCICIFSESFVREFAKRTEGKMAKKTVFSCPPEREIYVKELLLRDEYPDIFSIKSMLYSVCSEYVMNSDMIPREDDKMGIEIEILKYIADNYDKDISLKGMSEELGYEYHYLSRCFNKSFEMKFKKFLNQFRFRKAKDMLLASEGSISDVAIKSGFQSVRNFNKVFKELTGEEPRRYIKKEHYNLDKADLIKRLYDK